MTTTTIATDQDVATLINIFTVTRETQQSLVDVLTEATERVMRHRPGFVSATTPSGAAGTTSWRCSMTPRRVNT